MNYLPENKQVIEYIENLPGRGFHAICDTEDRLDAFYYVQGIYQRIADHLRDFFEYREPEEIDTTYANKTLVKAIERKANEYKLIYSALLKTWEYVKDDLIEPLELIGFTVNELNLIPLDAFLSICTEDAENMLEDIVFPEHVTGNYCADYSVSRSYKIFVEANEIVRTGKSTKQWEKIVQIYKKRYPNRELYMDLLKLSALKYPSIRPCLDHLDKFHELALMNAPALFHPEHVKHYPFPSHIVENGQITLKPKRTKKS